MLCDICQREAAGKCRGCGMAFCPDHGGSFCFRCSSAVVASEPRRSTQSTAVRPAHSDQPAVSGKGWLQCETTARPTIYLDDPEPPACHICKGLAKHICRSCQNLFCPEHGAGCELCASCARSSLLGLVVLGAILALFVASVFLIWILERV